MNLFPTPTIRAGAMLGFLTMAVIGWKIAGDPQQPAASQANPVTRTADRPARAARRGGPPAAVRQRMAALRAIASPDDRLRATMALARSLPLAEIAAWLDGRWFTAGEGFDLTLFNKLLKERWQLEDPAGMLAWSIKNNPTQARDSLAAMAATDPQQVLAFFKEHPDRDLELQALTEIAKRNPALALQAMGDLALAGVSNSSGGMTDDYLRQLLQRVAKSSPDALAAALDSLPPALRKQAEITLIKDRLATSFAEGIRQLWDRPDGWKIFRTCDSDGRKTLTSQIFTELANLPPSWRASLAANPYSFIDAAATDQWCGADLEGLGFTTAQAMSIRSMALSQLASSAPEKTLKLMAETDLDTNSRHNVISNLFASFHGTPAQSDALLAMLGSDEDRQLARNYLPKKPAATAPADRKIEQPADWLVQVAAMDPKSGASCFQYLYQLREWDSEKIAALGSQFQALPDDQKPQVAQALTRDNLSTYFDGITTLQGDALRFLLTNPPAPVADGQSASNITRQTSEFAAHWVKQDPAAASTWVQSLPAGEAKLWAQKNLATNWAQYDPAATDRWLNTLPAANRTQVREFMKTSK